MKRKIKIAGIVFACLVVVFIAALIVFPGIMVKGIVNTAGPLALGVDVSLDKASFQLLKGNAELKGLFVGNPKGFNTKSLCEVGTIRVALQPASLKSDTVIFDEILVDSPCFTYQKSLLTSNLSTLLKNLEGDSGDNKAEQPEKKEPDGKKVIIRRILIKDPMVKLSIKGIPMGAPIPMPDIELTDIGKETDGASIVDVLSDVFAAVLSSVTRIVTGSVDVVGKGGAAAVDIVGKGGKAAGKAAVGGVKSVGGGIMKLGKGVAEAVAGSDDSQDDGTEQ